jgi:hypothetical protein
MGYNTTFAVLRDTALSELPVTEHPVCSFDEASSVVAQDVTAAQVGPRDPLLAEDAPAAADDVEDGHLAVLERLLGTSLPDLMDARFFVVTSPE